MCLYWVGDFRGRDYQWEDVIRLWQSVDKHIDRNFNFYVLTNVEKVIQSECLFDLQAFHINLIPLKHNWPGWWSKVELFRPDLPKGKTLYLDLDSHVIRNLQPILDYEGDLVMFPTPHKMNQKFGRHKSDGVIYRYQAATILFTPGVHSWVYDDFKKSAPKLMDQYRSEQDLYAEWIPDMVTFPADWMVKLSKLKEIGKPSDDCIIVTGRPKEESFRSASWAPWLESVARGGGKL